jgi:lysozyme
MSVRRLIGFLAAAGLVGLFVARPYFITFRKKVTPRNYQCKEGGHYPDAGVKIPGGYPVVGADVSAYQENIHWQDLRDFSWDGYRIQFVFIRATMGLNRLDKKFFFNWEEARKVGLPRGAYHYFDAGQPAVPQARHFLRTMNKAKDDWQLPPVVDVEDARGLSPKALCAEVKKFSDEIQAVTGFRPILYTGATFYHDYIHQELPNMPLWVAHYNSRAPRISKEKSWLFWQFTEEASINGICNQVDLNVFHGSPEHFSAYLQGISSLR